MGYIDHKLIAYLRKKYDGTSYFRAYFLSAASAYNLECW